MYEYSITNRTAEAAGPLANIEAVDRVVHAIDVAATQRWHCSIVNRTNQELADSVDELNEQLHNMKRYVVACPVCGKPVAYGDLGYAYDGEPMCASCLIADGWIRCHNCSDWIREDDATEVDGEAWCSVCVMDDASECTHCHTWHDNSNLDTVRVYDSYTGLSSYETWCEDCRDDAYECDECGELYAGFGDGDGETRVWDRDGDYEYRHLCPTCEANMDHCACCGRTLDDDCNHDLNGDAYCCGCHSSEYLHSYGHTYCDHKYRLPDDPTPANMYLGVELETEAASTNDPEALAEAVTLAAGEDRIECKEDGSLDDGCEIVTQPMSAAYHLATLDDLGGRRLWDVILDACHDEHARSHDGGRCGLHIHVSRSWLNSDDKVTTFIRLIQGHAAEWRHFSRREKDRMSYCSLHSDYDDGISIADAPKVKRDKTRKDYSRYVAVNLNNDATIELRLWRGTLVKQTLRATIEATAALALIAGDDRTDVEALESWSWRDLVKQMVKTLDLYKLPSADLLAYLQARNL